MVIEDYPLLQLTNPHSYRLPKVKASDTVKSNADAVEAFQFLKYGIKITQPEGKLYDLVFDMLE